MPWLTIILALLSFFVSKRSGASNTGALLTAGLVGGAAYYTSHSTDWGKANLGSLDGVPPLDKPLLDSTGKVVTDPEGNTVMGNATGKLAATATTPSTGVFDVLKSWGATGTAAVIGTAAVVGTGSLTKYFPWLLAAGAAYLLLK